MTALLVVLTPRICNNGVAYNAVARGLHVKALALSEESALQAVILIGANYIAEMK